MSTLVILQKLTEAMTPSEIANDFVDNKNGIEALESNRSSVVGLIVLYKKKNTVVNFICILSSSLNAVYLLYFI